MESITLKGLTELSGDYEIIDIRNEDDFEYGHIAGAVNVPQYKINDYFFSANSENKDKPVVIYCKSGNISQNAAEELRSKGVNAMSLEGGYYGWLRQRITGEDKSEDIRRSLRGEFEETIWKPFVRAVKEYELVCNGDRVAVCISGGKDSMLLAALFTELKRVSDINFEVIYLVMDPGYSSYNREVIETNAKTMKIPIQVFETDIFDSVYNVEKNPCYLCARMRRGHLYKNAMNAGCNKIALGHHYDDVIETILMGMVYGGQIQTMMPKLHSAHFKGMELIRPLYLVREEEIKRWRDYNDLYFIQCACRFTDTCSTCSPDRQISKRMEIKMLIRELAEKNPEIEENIFHSIENVNLDKVMQYKDRNGAHYIYQTEDTENGVQL